MRKFLERAWFSEFVRNVFTLVVGVGSAQLISIIVMPILTHLYEPVFIGLLGVFMSIVIIFRMISSGGYEAAILLPKEEKEARNILYLCLGFNLLATLIATLLAFGFHELFLYFYRGENLLLNVIWLLPVSVFFESGDHFMRYWHNRHKRYKMISVSRVARASTIAVVSVVMGWQGSFLYGLIIGYVLGQIVGWGLLFFQHNPLLQKNTIVFQDIKRIAQTYSQFFKFGVLGSWFNSLGAQLPFFILPTLPMGAVMVGFYTITHRIMYAPLNLISASISGVYYEKVSKEHQKGNSLNKITRQTAGYMFLFGLIPISIIMIFGPSLFAFVFGTDYEVAGKFARWLAPWFFIKFISHPLSFLVDVKMKLLQQLLFNIVMFLSQYGVLVGVGLYIMNTDVIFYYGMIGLLIASIYLIYLLHLGEVFTPISDDKRAKM